MCLICQELLTWLCKGSDPHTFGDDAFHVNYIRVVKLSHDAGLTQEVSPLFVRITGFQRLNGHTDLSLARHFETPTADFTKFTFGREKELTVDQKHIQDERVMANIC